MKLKSLLITFALLLNPVAALANNAQDHCVAAPELAVADTNVLTVNTTAGLYSAVNNAKKNTTIIIEPGVYRLSSIISVTTDNLTIRGLETRCDKVILLGKGMETKNHDGVTTGFWINAKSTTIANLTVGEVYHHPIQISGSASTPRIYNVRMINAGQQFVKANPNSSGEGVNNGIVEFSVMEYTNGPPKTSHDDGGTGYTNGVDVHSGRGWIIRRNKFLNFHTPDGSDHEFNAAILMWRGASDTLTENNLFFNVDRAIAYGLEKNDNDHTGGIIRNNLIVITPGLYSNARRRRADAAILVWSSPRTKVLHNTIVTNGNIPFSIESRWNSTDALLSNNLADAPIVHSAGKINREFCKFTARCRKYLSAYAKQNEIAANASWFIDPAVANLRLHEQALPLIRPLPLQPDATIDITGRIRPAAATPGAFQVYQ